MRGSARAGPWVTVLLLLVAVPQARAEYALLRNGQRLHITGYERAGEVVRLHVAGGRIEVAAAELIAVEPEEVFPAPAVAAASGPFGELIRAAAQRHRMDEHLIASVIAVESDFNPRAVSRKQARGLMQLMPQTAAQYAVTDIFDPAQNIEAGTRYLKELLARYNQDLQRALAAYNAGPERVERHAGIPPIAETRVYVERVIRDWKARKTKKG